MLLQTKPEEDQNHRHHLLKNMNLFLAQTFLHKGQIDFTQSYHLKLLIGKNFDEKDSLDFNDDKLRMTAFNVVWFVKKHIYYKYFLSVYW